MKIGALKILALGLGLGLVIPSAVRAEPPASVQQEVSHLIDYIADSGCEFERNGSWNNAKAAAAHVSGKYDFLVRWGRIETTNDFIDGAATKSSLSGIPYEIRCGTASPMPAGMWLYNELTRYRMSRQSINRD